MHQCVSLHMKCTFIFPASQCEFGLKADFHKLFIAPPHHFLLHIWDREIPQGGTILLSLETHTIM